MATHDYSLANQSGASFRTDLNNALAAIQSNNSNSSSPATTVAYQWWADTTSGTLKIRNSNNNAWVELFQLDGTLTLEDGSASTPALAFRDDLDTGIFSGGANEFNISTGGTERFVIDSSGNCGIGTSSLAGKFNIQGAAGAVAFQTTDATNSTFQISHPSSALTLLSGSSSQNLGFGIGGTEKARFDSSGRLLLGTTTEGDASADDLTIATSGDTGITIRSGTSNSGNIFFSDGTSGADEYEGIISYSHSDNTMRFATTDGTERVRIQSAGAVHIGTSTDRLGEKLHVLGHGIVSSSAEATNMMLFGTFGGSDALIGAFNDIDVVFRQNNTEQMRLDTDGRLLVGQTTRSSTEAASKLCVSVAISGGGQGVITASDTSSNDFGCGLVVNKASSTTTSSARFIQFYANNFGQPMGGIVGNGTENAQLVTLSDERYKKNIKPLSGILEKINKLKTISFDWKHKNESVKAGFIAQNVQEIFPEYVVDNIGNDESNKKMGTTGGMSAGYIAILTAAIQELSAKVAALEAA
tara:strand:- start:980 stop:2560 length:1581 start_codon:yes stop_codon:yes gene_type:complete